MLIAVGLFVVAVALPHPMGIWYIGRRPQWVIAVDHAGLTIGPSSDPMLLGWVPLLVAKLIVVSVPVWLVWRYGFRRRGGTPGA